MRQGIQGRFKSQITLNWQKLYHGFKPFRSSPIGAGTNGSVLLQQMSIGEVQQKFVRVIDVPAYDVV